MSYTKRKWLPDILNYPNEPKQIITGVKVEIQQNYFKRLFDTILPETDAEYMKEKDEIEANVKLVCAAPDLLEALIEVVRISDRKHDAWDKAKAAINKAINGTDER